MKNITVISDIHGKFSELNSYLKPNTIYLQVGDFGFFPHIPTCEKPEVLKIPTGSSIYTCMGNHENWDVLDEFGYSITELAPNVFYCPFGTELTLESLKILFAGKADSIDKHQRIPHYSWWPQEVVTFKDFNNLNFDSKPDLVISHTVPNKFKTLPEPGSYHDTTRDALDIILEKLRPQRWIAGHFHEFFDGVYDDNCHWTVLPDFPKQNSFLKLKEI